MAAETVPTRRGAARRHLAPAPRTHRRPAGVVLRRLVVAFVVMAGLTIAAVAVVQTRLIAAQGQLDALRSEVVTAQAELDETRQQIVEASSPGALINEAQALGMVEPELPMVLSATGDGGVVVAAPDHRTDAAATEGSTDAATAGDTDAATAGGTADTAASSAATGTGTAAATADDTAASGSTGSKPEDSGNVTVENGAGAESEEAGER